MKEVKILIIGTDINAYYMARNFHEEYNIKSHLIGRVSMFFTSLSQIIEDVTIVENLIEDNVFVDTLVSFAKKIKNKKIILIGCNDDYVSLIIKHREILKKYFLFNYTDYELLNKIVNKENFYNAYNDSIIDLPLTYIYNINDDFDNNRIKEFSYPLILKPSNVIEYHNHSFVGQKKVYKIFDYEELVKVINDVRNSGYNDKLMIQEFIPGDDTLLFDCVFYVSSKKEVWLQTFAQIGLQEHTESGIGNLTVLINGYNEFNNTDEIKEKLKKFLLDIGFNGICEFDLKYDVRDKKFKVFEINPRQARSSYYLTKCGYNLAKYLVDDLIYHKNHDFVFIDNKVALSFVPDFVVRTNIKNKKYKKEFFRLKRNKMFTHPLSYKKDLSVKRRVWLFKRGINYIRKYMKNKW